MKLKGRQQEIVDASIGLIADLGIQQLTIKNIAGKLGITEPAIYRHFESKFDIIFALLDSFGEMSSDILQKTATQKLPPLAKLEAFILDRLTRMSGNPNLAKVMFSEELFQSDERLAGKVMEIMHEHKDIIQTIIEEGRVDGSIRTDIDSNTLFRIIFGPVRLLIKQWTLSGFRFDLEEEGRKLWDAELKLLHANKELEQNNLSNFRE
jgi:TetR/AcrR family fatty acid metabolism transcriptional regulator